MPVLTGLSSLDSCVDQTLSASHGVKEELCWCQAGEVGVLHKASTLRTVVILNEVRQRAVFEAKGNSFTLHILLPHHSDNLNKEMTSDINCQNRTTKLYCINNLL